MGRLDRRLSRVTKALGEFVLTIERNVIYEVGERVVRKTPVDTGYARGNWTPGINARPVRATTTLDPGAVATPAKINALAAILRLGDTFYITNNASYIQLLNEGYSPQAGINYVRDAVAEGVKAGVDKTAQMKGGR